MCRLTAILILFSISCLAYPQQVNFRLNDLENRQRTFNDVKGEKLTIIDFWATWCRPCLRAIPGLSLIHEQYHQKGVNVIGINCDGPRSASRVLPVARSMGIRYTVLRDMDARLMKELGLSSFPSLVIAGADGKVLWRHEGYFENDTDLIREQIEKLLSGS